MRQPDIEIYLREDHVKDLLAWIPEALGPLVLEEAKGNTRQGYPKHSGNPVDDSAQGRRQVDQHLV